MIRVLTILTLTLAASMPRTSAAEGDQSAKPAESHSTSHQIFMYLPNRVLDTFDVIRFRLRAGPGFAADARATGLVSAFVGSYTSVYAGLPGPRNRPPPKLPVGLESKSGIRASVVDATISGGLDPDYGPAEFGAGVQLFFIGLDIGLEPLEFVDLLTGFFMVDIKHDDL